MSSQSIPQIWQGKRALIHAMKTLIHYSLNFGTRRRGVVTLIPWPLYSPEKLLPVLTEQSNLQPNHHTDCWPSSSHNLLFHLSNHHHALTLLVERKTWGSPLHATPVATSLCSLNAANGIYGRLTSQTLMLQSTTKAQLAMWYFRWGLHLMCPTDAMVWIVYSKDGLPARSHT